MVSTVGNGDLGLWRTPGPVVTTDPILSRLVVSQESVRTWLYRKHGSELESRNLKCFFSLSAVNYRIHGP